MTPPSAPRLVTLTAIVVALAAAVGITSGTRTVVERPLIAPGLVAADVTGLLVMNASEPPISIVIDAEGTRVREPVPGPADEATVRDLISAVVAARADRVVRGAGHRASLGLEMVDVAVLVHHHGKTIHINRGTAVPASGQVWLGIGDDAFLVPAWVGEALDRDLASLRRRQVFPPVAITGIELHGRGVDFVLAGVPLRRRDEGAGVRIARAAIARLDAALAKVVIDVFVNGDTSTSELTVRVLGGAEPHELTVHGACPGHPTHVLVAGSAGVGCVAASIIDDVVSAAATIASASGIEPSLAPGAGADIESIRAGDVILARRGAGWVLTLGDERVDADDDAVAAFFETLALEGVPGPLRTVPATATWNVTLLGGATETWRWYPNAVRRDDEPNALQLPDATLAAVDALGAPLRNLTLLVIDAAMVNSIHATGADPATVVRGQLVGEWTVQSPTGKSAAPAAQQLADMLATFRGARWLAANELGAIRRTLTFAIDAPPIPGGKPSSHTIAIGAARPGDRCAARVDAHLPIELSPTLCATLLAPLAQ